MSNTDSGAAAPKTFTAEEVEKMIAASSAKTEAALLAKLGAKSPEEISSALGKLRETEESQKSEMQRLIERATKAEAESAGSKTYREKLAAFMTKRLESLTVEQRAAVERFAGDDPAKIADTLEFLEPTWGKPVAPNAAAPKVEAGAPNAAIESNAAPKPAPAAPASAAMPAGAPTPAAPKNKFEEWQGLRNPVAQDLFYQLNGPAIEAARPN